jgi:hypothetical protein
MVSTFGAYGNLIVSLLSENMFPYLGLASPLHPITMDHNVSNQADNLIEVAQYYKIPQTRYVMWTSIACKIFTN